MAANPPYPVTQLVAEAFYTSGIVSRQFQTVSGDQFQTGVLKLNEILSDTNIEKDMIPYYTYYHEFNFIPGTEQYFIGDCVEIDSLTFFLDSIRYQTNKKSRDQYLGEGRAQNVESLPFNWYSQLVLNGTQLFVYFFPDSNYPVQVNGLFKLSNVYQPNQQSSAQQIAIWNNLTLIFDLYYINYLQYRLADRLCTAYNFAMPPGAQKQLLSYMQMISKRSSPLDLTQQKISTLVSQDSINYAQVNLGKGWTI